MSTNTIRVEFSDVDDVIARSCESFWMFVSEMIADEYLESLRVKFDFTQAVMAN
ncbi:hypothetical protein ACFL3H_07075 [Gemmatimonadota bacterium]